MAATGVLLLAGAGAAFGLGRGHRVESHETITHAITALSIDAGSGDVSVRGGAASGTVEITRTTRSTTASGLSGGASWQDNTLALTPACSGVCQVDYEVRVPDGVAVTAHTGSGDIELTGTLGDLSLEAGSGDVSADVTSSSVTTRTGSGDMELRLRSAPTQLIAGSGSGDVEVKLPEQQRYAVDAESGSGDVEIGVQQQGTSDRHIQVRTGSGDISLQSG